MSAQSKHRTATADRQQEETIIEKQTEQPNVMEMAEGRESIDQKINSLETSVRQMISKFDDLHTESRTSADLITDELVKLEARFDDRIDRLGHRIDVVATRIKVANSSVADYERRTWDREEKDGGFIMRNARTIGSNAKRVFKPRKPSPDTMQGAIYCNAMEYIALVTAGQLAPVQTMNFVARIAFIAV